MGVTELSLQSRFMNVQAPSGRTELPLGNGYEGLLLQLLTPLFSFFGLVCHQGGMISVTPALI